MNCEEYFLLMSGHLDQMNTPEEEERLKAHLQVCDACRQAMAQMEENDLLLAEVPEAPVDLTRRIMAEVTSQPRKTSRKKTIYRWMPIAASLAAVLGIVLISGKMMDRELKTADSVAMETTSITEADVPMAYGSISADVDSAVDSEVELQCAIPPESSIAYPSDSIANSELPRRRTEQRPIHFCPFLMILHSAEEEIPIPEDAVSLDLTGLPATEEAEAAHKLLEELAVDFPQLDPNDPEPWSVQIYLFTYQRLVPMNTDYSNLFETVSFLPPREDMEEAGFLIIVTK